MATSRVSPGEAKTCACGAPARQSPVAHGPKPSRCVSCQRKYQAAATSKHRQKVGKEACKCQQLRRAYGISFNEYQRQLEAQKGVCAICGEPEPTKGRSLAVDHCHATGAVRGLLCRPCNTSLGQMRDRPNLLRAAASYLENPPWR